MGRNARVAPLDIGAAMHARRPCRSCARSILGPRSPPSDPRSGRARPQMGGVEDVNLGGGDRQGPAWARSYGSVGTRWRPPPSATSTVPRCRPTVALGRSGCACTTVYRPVGRRCRPASPAASTQGSSAAAGVMAWGSTWTTLYRPVGSRWRPPPPATSTVPPCRPTSAPGCDSGCGSAACTGCSTPAFRRARCPPPTDATASASRLRNEPGQCTARCRRGRRQAELKPTVNGL
jgi:hypothetical protein